MGSQALSMTQAVKVHITPTATCARAAAEQTVARPERRASYLPPPRPCVTWPPHLGPSWALRTGNTRGSTESPRDSRFQGSKQASFQWVEPAAIYLLVLLSNRGGSRGHDHTFEMAFLVFLSRQLSTYVCVHVSANLLTGISIIPG